jgi:hypothetical protein
MMEPHRLRPRGPSEVETPLTVDDLVITVSSQSPRDSARRAVVVEAVQDALALTRRALGGSLSTRFETVAVLDERSRPCTTVWLRVHGREAGDQDHRPGSAAPALSKFFSRGTLLLIRWMQEDAELHIAHLQQALKLLATVNLGNDCAEPAPPTSADLVKAIAAWEKAKSLLHEGDCVRILVENGSVELDAAARIADPKALLLDKKVINPDTDMIYIIEMPDYHQTGEWKLKHGRTHVTTNCKTGAVLDRFYRRELDIRPGDALHCKVEFETSYGPDYEVLDESFRIVEVIEVLRGSPNEPSLTLSDDCEEAPGKEEPDVAAPGAEQHEDMIEELEGEFGVLTLRRLPIH